MEPITVAKVAAAGSKSKFGKNLIFALPLAAILPFLLLICCFCKLISAFIPDGAVTSTSEFDVSQTAVYQSVKTATQPFYDELWEEMGEQRAQLMEQYTEPVTLQDENGEDYEGTKCDAIVTRRLNYLGDAYVVAYLSYVDGLNFNTGEIDGERAVNFLEDICEITVTEGGYREFEITNEFLSLDEITEKYFTDESTAQEFQQSCYAYSQFFDISSSKVDAEAGNYTKLEFSSSKLLEIPLYLQYKGDWAGFTYGNGTIQKNGCCPTCLAMVLSYLRQEIIYPDDVAGWAGNKYYVNGAGTAWSIFPVVYAKWGVRCTDIGKSQELLISALREGKPVIASMGPGTFTKGGHFIVLSGITADGKIKVNDPNDSALKNHINTRFEVSLILREAKNMWVCEVP